MRSWTTNLRAVCVQRAHFVQRLHVCDRHGVVGATGQDVLVVVVVLLVTEFGAADAMVDVEYTTRQQ